MHLSVSYSFFFYWSRTSVLFVTLFCLPFLKCFAKKYFLALSTIKAWHKFKLINESKEKKSFITFSFVIVDF